MHTYSVDVFWNKVPE